MIGIGRAEQRPSIPPAPHAELRAEMKYREIIKRIEADGWRLVEWCGRIAKGKVMSEYLVVIEHEGNAWGAFCSDLPGLGVVGDTREEVEQLVREAISFHLDGLRQSGDPIPKPSAVGTTLVQVPAA